MKRIAVLALALLVLPACGRVGSVSETTAETTTVITTTSAIETTTQEETTTEAPFVPSNGESNGVKWRTLDLYDEANAEVKAWLEGRYARSDKNSEYKLSDTKTLIEREQHEHGPNDIWLRDNATGKETLLIQGDDGSENELAWYCPFVCEVLDERYFLYDASGYEWPRGCGIYDTQRLLAIPVQQPTNTEYVGIRNNAIYLSDFIYGTANGQMHIYAVPLENLDTVKSLASGENLLEGIPEADMGSTYYFNQTVSPDAQYLTVMEEKALRIFNLRAHAYLCRVPIEISNHDYGPYFHCHFRDEHTIYCYEVEWGVGDKSDEATIRRYALEIILP